MNLLTQSKDLKHFDLTKNGLQSEPVSRRVLVEELLLADNLKGDLGNHIAGQTNGSGVLSGRTNWRSDFNLLLVKLANTGSCHSSNDVSGLYGTEQTTANASFYDKANSLLFETCL
jgi:hypothetical protein